MQIARERDTTDILIIGSGASAGPFAWHLSQVPGIKIVCLEQGDWVNPQESLTETRQRAETVITSEAQAQRQRLVAEPPREGVRYVANGYPYDYSRSYWEPILGNAVGGATVHYTAAWSRMHPSDFVVKSLDGIADDWPIRYWDLAPYYDLNDNMVGIAGVPGNPAYPPKSVDLMPPHKLSPNAEVLARGFSKLGWHWWPLDNAMITRPHRGRMPCPANCDFCDQGCPRQAKNSSDVVFWPEAVRNGVTLKTRARVREIVVNRRGLADGVVYYDADGQLHQQNARLVVVACNGIGTPRLLLNSTSNRFPKGLANSSGQVGRNLMGHPLAGVSAVMDTDTPPGRRQHTNGIGSEQFYESDPSRGFARGFWMFSTGYTGPINAALGELPTPRPTTIPAELRGGPSAEPIEWGDGHHAAFQQQFTQTINVSIMCEEMPLETNRVELHPTLTDDTGIPAVKIFYQRSENTERVLHFALDRGKELLLAAGAKQVTAANINTAAPGHYLGTARMGNDPERSVVDRWGRAHDVKNLFIIDGSVFTTSASALPTSTIQAIALRTADYIKTNARNLLS